MSDLFGSLSGLATALGVTKPGWFSEPDRYLKTVLSDPEQRAALIEVVDELLGGEDATTTDGRTVVPLASVDPVQVSATLTERDGLIDVSLLVQVAVAASATAVGGRLDLAVPLVAAAGDRPSPDPLLLGTAHGAITLDIALELPTAGGAGPGGIDLRAAELSVRIPTDGALPEVGLALRGLRMPGAAQPTDIEVRPESIGALEGALMPLVLGLVRAQLDAAPAEVRAIAGLLGLVDADGVPDFPVDELIADGPVALARWWARALADDARDGWYAHLQTLLGGAGAVLDGFPAVDVTLAGALRLRVSVRTAPGAAGLPRVTPVLAVVTTAAPGVELALQAEPVSLDLATGDAVPLPGLRATATISGAGGSTLLDETVTVDGDDWALEVGRLTAGFALTADRTPRFVLAAADVTVGQTHYDTLDLTDADALAELGGGVLSDAADALLARLDDIGDALSAMLGLGDTAALRLDPQRLLADPIGAVRDRWRRVLASAPDVVRARLAPLRDALAATVGAVVSGDGTADDPYRFELTDGLALTAVVDGSRVAVALTASASAPLAGDARLRGDARIGLLRADLSDAQPSASVLTDLSAALSVVHATGGVLTLGDDDTIAVRTRGLGVRVRWRPGARVDLAPWLRTPEVVMAGQAVPLDALSDAGVLDGGVTPLADIAQGVLDETDQLRDAATRHARRAADAWASTATEAIAEAVQQLGAGVLTGSDALTALRDLLAWADPAAGTERLALDALVVDPAAELSRWVTAAFGIDPVGREVVDADRLLAAVARVARLAGIEPPVASGAVGDPLRLILPGLEVLAQVAGDDAARLASRVTGVLDGWTPGDALPDAADLLAALAADADVDGVLADVLAGRSLSPAAIDGLVARWAGTDGVIGVAESALPAGLDLHRIAGLVHGAPLARPDVQAAVTAVLGAAPARLVLVGVEAAGEPDLLPARGDAGTALEIDLTAPGAPAASFALPAPAPVGLTVVRLPGKAAAVANGATVSTESGFDAQVARLQPILAALAGGTGDVVVVAGGAAGRVAAQAAAATGIATVLTVGTPFTPVALGDVDTGPAADALRLMASLVALDDAGGPVDAAVQRGRDLVTALLARDVRGDPLTELTAPDRALPDGVDVRAIVGTFDADTVREAITALVRHAIDVRATARTALAAATAAVSRAGVRIPLAWGTEPGGIRAKLETDLDLGAIAAAVAGGADLPRVVTLRLRVWADGRWLVGGPDPGRVAGARPLALRAITFEVEVPLPTRTDTSPTAPARGSGRIVLHDALVFGARFTRRRIDLADAGALLPELRALLGEAAADLHRSAAADPAAAAVVELLRGLGLLGPDDGFDVVTLTQLLTDPGAALHAALGRARPALAAALRAAAGDTRGDAGDTVRITAGPTVITVDLAAQSITATLSAPAPAPAAPTLEVSFAATTTAAALTVRLGWTAGLGLSATVTADGAGPVHVTAQFEPGAYGPAALALWPPATDTAARLGEAALGVARDAALRVGAQALRETLSATAAARDAVDGVLDAVGLLAAADTAGARALIWPGPLLTDARRWLASRAGGLAAAAPRLLQSAAAALGIAAPTPGTLELVPGLMLTAAGTGDGGLRLGMRVDAGRFADVPEFVLTVDAGADVRAGAAVVPVATVRVGTDAGALEVGMGPQPGAGIDVTVALRPAGSGVIALYPAGPGFGAAAASAATATVQAALPWLLTRLAGHVDDADDAVRTAARVTARVGAALGLATVEDGVTTFDPAAFRAFVDTPAAALQAALGSAAAHALPLLRDALDELFAAGDVFEATAAAGVLTLTVGPASARLTLTWDSGTHALGIGVASDAIPVVGPVRGHAVVSDAGVQSVTVVVGPTELDFGAVTVTPLARFAWTPATTAVELGLAAGAESRAIARLAHGPGAPWAFTLVAETGALDPATGSAATASVSADPAAVAGALARTLLGLAADVVLALEPVSEFLDTTLPVGGITIRDVLDGVVLDGDGLDLTIIDDLDQPGRLLTRLGELANGLVPALPPVPVGAGMGIGVFTDGDLIGFRLDVAAETPLTDGDDVVVSLVADAAWLGPEPAGVRVGILRLAGGSAEPALGVEVRGIGIRISNAGGPLLDAGLRIDAVRLLTYAHIADGGGGLELGGGVSVALEGLGLPLGGAGNGANPIAEGVMPSGGTDDDAPRPAFSPTLDVFRRPTDAGIQVAARAGTTRGPWWLTVQREFGPIYLEQVGLDVTTADGSITSISVLIDGAVSLFGFAAAVDDLSLTYRAPGSPFAPDSWSVDVAGFAIAADVSGLTLAGGLRKFELAAGGVEYLGMLLARFGTYGLTVYGGFAQVGEEPDRFLSLFLVGGVNGPIGGVPAFFVTGIAGGFGVNRRLIVPTDLDLLPEFALMRALDSAASNVDPFSEIEKLRTDFPAERGSFWFAAGLSFNSFVLVDGIVAVAVEFGNGFELNILGLARMSLPRPQLTLVSIELALVARVSSREGVILVQAQLTDNSWLLNPAVRLTGGFAFAAWFGGPNKGQFVLTMGGYHPDFHREGYPVVPRLGVEWRIGDWVVISGKGYFALTSEALMAGLKIEIHAELGPAWAHIVLGADAIIYFDPFWLNATVYASIDAGITIDVWIGEITLSVHIGARITLEGPPFHAVGTLEIGPASVTVEIGDATVAPQALTWPAFVEKYLEDAGAGTARALTAITGRGTVPPAGGARTGDEASPDGQPDRPFRVIAEFEVTLTSTVPFAQYRGARLTTTGTPDASGRVTLPGLPRLGIAPMQKDGVEPLLTLSVRERAADGTGAPGDNLQARAGVTGSHAEGDFPFGVWGPPPSDATVPEGELVVAPNTVALRFAADMTPFGTPPEIPYHQVRTGPRRILPLLPSVAAAHLDGVRTSAQTAAAAVAALRSTHPALDDTAIATSVLADRGGLGPVRADDWQARLAAPVRLGSLGEDLGQLTAEAAVTASAPGPAGEVARPRPARVTAILSAPTVSGAVLTGADVFAGGAGTSVSPELLGRVLGSSAAPTMSAPTPATVAATLDAAVPTRLVRTGAAPATTGTTVLAPARARLGVDFSGGTSRASRLAAPVTRQMLAEDTAQLTGDGLTLTEGQVALLELPDGARDNATTRPVLRCVSGAARVVVLGAGGVLADVEVKGNGRVEIPAGAREVIVVAGPPVAPATGMAVVGGWHDASLLPATGLGALIGAGCVVSTAGFAAREADAAVAWTTPAALTRDLAPTSTTFRPAGPGRTVQAVAVGVTGTGSDGVAVGLENAEPIGAPQVTTDSDGASVVTMAVRATGTGPVIVNAAVDGARDVTGVFAASTPEDDDPAETARLLAKAVAARGLTALDRPVAAAGPAVTRLRWSTP